jgi:hypothetical protein
VPHPGYYGDRSFKQVWEEEEVADDDGGKFGDDWVENVVGFGVS